MGDVFVVTTMWWWPCGGTVDELVVKDVLATFLFSLQSSTSLSTSQFGGVSAVVW